MATISTTINPADRVYINFSGLHGVTAVAGTVRDILDAWTKAPEVTAWDVVHALLVGKATLVDEGHLDLVDIVDTALEAIEDSFHLIDE